MKTLKELFWYLLHEDDGEPLAQHIESGGDLSQKADEQREVLARLVRGKSPRKRGQKLGKGNAERDWQICFEIACLSAYGLPAYTDSGGGKEDACSVVAKQHPGLGERSIREIWQNRDKLVQAIADLYEGQSLDGPRPEANPSYADYIDRLCNAWREKD